MLRRIRQLAKGNIEYHKQNIVLSEEDIAVSFMQGKDYEGSFSFHAASGEPVSGLVYCENARVECLCSQFSGRQITIPFRVKGNGLQEGYTFNGCFNLLLEGQTLSVPFHARVTAPRGEGAAQNVETLADFAALARENWEEALKLFSHPAFTHIIGREEHREQLLYKGLTCHGANSFAMEEFLIACGRKKRIDFSVRKEDEYIEVIKDGWGYLSLSITADAPFVSLAARHIKTEDFEGSICRIPYHLEEEKMHGGRNFCRVTFECVQGTKSLEFEAVKAADIGHEKNPAFPYRIRLTSLYMQYRLRQMVTGVWAKKCLEQLEELAAIETKNPLVPLFQAWCYALNHQGQEAEKLLIDYEEAHYDKNYIGWSLYFLIRTMIEQDENVRSKCFAVIDDMYDRNTEDPLAAWTYYHSLKTRADNASRFAFLEHQRKIRPGDTVIYAEAAHLVQKEPQLLTGLTGFRLELLLWIFRRGGVSEQIVDQLFELADKSRRFQRKVCILLGKGEKLYPKEDHVESICRYLLSGNCRDPKFSRWYALGVRKELRLNGLYEAYVECMRSGEIEELPEPLAMYFEYESKIPYQNRAILYTSVIAAKRQDPQMYLRYQKTMAKFAYEQLLACHIDENLGVVYSDLLTPDLISEKTAGCFAQIAFRKRIGVQDPKYHYAYVYQWQLKEPVCVPITGGVGYADLYSDDYVILFEDPKGRRCADVYYTVDSLLNPEPYLDAVLSREPKQTPYVLYLLKKASNHRDMSINYAKSYDHFVLNMDINPVYKAKLLPEILIFYGRTGEKERIRSYLRLADFNLISPGARHFLADLMVDIGMYDRAYEMIQEFGVETISAQKRASLFEILLSSMAEEADDELLRYIIVTFLEHQYNKGMLSYLCSFYSGPISVMQSIWKYAYRNELDTRLLEERILFSALYCDWTPKLTYPVFASYRLRTSKEILTNAYLTLAAHHYIYDDLLPEKDIIGLFLKKENTLSGSNDVIRLALLKYYAEESSYDPKFAKCCDRLLGLFTARGIFLPFYEKLPENMQIRHQIKGMVYACCKANSKSRILIHYSADEDGHKFHTEDMQEVYPGMFVKSFSLFFGEMVQWYITEENGKRMEAGPKMRLLGPAPSDWDVEGRLDLINKLRMAQLLCDRDAYISAAKEYMYYDILADRLFDLK